VQNDIEARLRLLRVIRSAKLSGGGPIEAARVLDSQLFAMGHRVDMLCLDSEVDPRLLYPGEVFALGPSRFVYGLNSKLYNWLKVHSCEYDAVIVDGLWQFHSFAVSRVMRAAGVPYFVFTHGMLDPWFQRAYPLKHLKKVAYWLLVERKVLGAATAVLFTCEEERRLAKTSFPFANFKEEITTLGVVESSVGGPGTLEFTRRFPALLEKRVLLFMGRIHEKKGIDLLISAFGELSNAHPTAHLLIAGPGDVSYIETLKRLADGFGIGNRLTWAGMLGGTDKAAAYAAAEVLCLPSHQENFGLVIPEALSAGCPVIISDKVNIWREVLASGAAIVGSDDANSTVHSLRCWLEMPEHSRRLMSERATIAFRSKFNARSAAEGLLAVIERYVA
jgi:glycosyltransferase involved in cell wall biosynthesis